jgi:hypothetical protein
VLAAHPLHHQAILRFLQDQPRQCRYFRVQKRGGTGRRRN